MATLIIDIETVGEEWDGLDDTTQQVLTRWIERGGNSESQKKLLYKDVREGLGFSPLTGRVVALGVYDRERELGTVYYSSDDAVGDGEIEGVFNFKVRDEAAMLKDFWEGARQYDTFVTFNGRAFDVPFLLHRSIVCGVRPTVDLLSKRYLAQQKIPYHVDLQDELTFYGAMSRRPSLHLFCRAYGIKSPKMEVGGDDVAELFRLKKFRDIARYNARDLRATATLYEKWLEYLAPSSFLSVIDF